MKSKADGRGRGLRLRVAAVLAAAVAVLGGTMAASSAQAASPRLSAARFIAIDSLKTAFLSLSDKPTAVEVANVRRVCMTLDRSDRLLDVSRTLCLTTLKLARTGVVLGGGCTTLRDCVFKVAVLRAVFSQVIVNGRQWNRIIEGELSPGPCRTRLRVSAATLRSAEKARRALELLERGLRTVDHALVRRAEHQFDAALRQRDDNLTATQRRDAFRRDCAPIETPATPAPAS